MLEFVCKLVPACDVFHLFMLNGAAGAVSGRFQLENQDKVRVDIIEHSKSCTHILPYSFFSFLHYKCQLESV
jgi:hypothetical protein